MYCSTTDVAICHLLMFQKHGCPALVTGVYYNVVAAVGSNTTHHNQRSIITAPFLSGTAEAVPLPTDSTSGESIPLHFMINHLLIA